MSVFVVEIGCYSDQFIAGVYATLEAAMAAHPIPANPQHKIRGTEPGWHQVELPGSEQRSWDNGLDWSEAATISEWPVIGTDDLSV